MDRIFASWLERQETDWNAFAGLTDLVTVTRCSPESPCQKFLAEFRCKGLIWHPERGAVEAGHFLAGIYFGEDHLRRIDPLQLVWLLSPAQVWHPNVLGSALCTGHLRPGVGLIDILYQVYGILTYQNFNLGDFLNPDAAAWARDNRARFPIDGRPLKRRNFSLEVREVV